MAPNLDQACCASLPLPALSVLADLRREPGIRVVLVDDRAWVHWEAGTEAVLRRVLPVAGVELFARHNGSWYRPGTHLPAFGIPLDHVDETMPLAQVIVPEPVVATTEAASPPSPIPLSLRRDDRPRATSAVRCNLQALATWAETATTAAIAALAAAHAGDVVLLVGRRLPALAGGQRYWGEGILVPLGFRSEPHLPESSLRRALGFGDDALLLIVEADGFEVVPRTALRPLSRAGVRLLAEERST